MKNKILVFDDIIDLKYQEKIKNILIFSSNLQHEVNENKSNEDRISYSFNVTLINEK